MPSSGGMEKHSSGCWLPLGYGDLLDRSIEVFGADPRVRAAWVHGSVARGDADEVSDLDIIIAVPDDDIPAFAPSWRERLNTIAPTVMARPSFGATGSWLAITPTAQRFDLWVEPTSRVASSAVRDRHLLFDRDHLADAVPAPAPPASASADRLDGLARQFGAVASVARVADELLMLQVIWALRWVLYEAYVETNRPQPTTGLKRWSAKLTDAQMDAFANLPTGGDPAPIIATLEGVLGALPNDLPAPVLPAVVLPPEGTIRGLRVDTAPEGTWGRNVAEEYFALHLYLSVVLHRDDWLLGVVAANDARRLLYELFLDANGRPAASSPADWSGRLTEGQRQDLLRIPSGAPDRQRVIDAHLVGRHVLSERGREILGDDWPTEMEAAVVPLVDRLIGPS